MATHNSFEGHIDYTFVWPYEGTAVAVAGSFDNWTAQAPMTRNTRDGVWELRRRLPAAVFQYKFVVDGKWCYDVKKPQATDDQGNINNCFDGAFMLAAQVAKEIDRIKFVKAVAGPDGRERLTYLMFAREGGEYCEGAYPWHGTWQFAENTPDKVVTHGRFVMAAMSGQRFEIRFEPGISALDGVPTAVYDRRTFKITTASGLIFARKL